MVIHGVLFVTLLVTVGADKRTGFIANVGGGSGVSRIRGRRGRRGGRNGGDHTGTRN